MVEPVIDGPSDPVVSLANVYCGNMKLLVLEVAEVAATKLPVQLAPVGQQAMLSAASREQCESVLQQMLELFRVEQGL